MEKYFENKRALVTGAGQGIGRGVALRLLKCKAEVIAVSKDPRNLESLKNEAAEFASKLHPIALDLSDWESSRRAVEDIEGPIDLLVNNAGVTCVKPFLELTEQDIDRVLAVNLKAAVNVAQAVVKRMLKQADGGAIVNVSSTASSLGLLNHTVYCASKSALDSVTRVMAAEFGKHKIRVNSVNPTVVMTEMGKKAWGDAAVAAPMLNRIPLGRFVEVDEVADAVLFLLSDKASAINGISLPVDGGQTST